MKTKLSIILSVVLLIIISCSKELDDKCVSNNIEYVTSVISPSTGTVNENINIEVVFGIHNGCGNFGKFIESQNGNTKTIEVEARYEGCVCTQVAGTKSINYVFKTPTPGNYTLKFKSGPTEYITAILSIN